MSEENKTALAYVDGSFNVKTKEYSGGVVLFYEDKMTCLSIKGNDPEYGKMRNVAGEILAAKLAMTESLHLGVKRLTIFYDYQGIASWCLGEWRVTKKETREYKEYYDSLQGKLEVFFQKVKSHSGNEWNDLADKLAKDALSLND